MYSYLEEESDLESSDEEEEETPDEAFSKAANELFQQCLDNHKDVESSQEEFLKTLKMETMNIKMTNNVSMEFVTQTFFSCVLQTLAI